MRTHPGKINVITLGCAKNLVDSEILMRQLEGEGFDVVHNPEGSEADAVIINTCGFIHDAREESVDAILEVVEARKKGLVGKVFVMGCLSERYREALAGEIPEVDRFFGVRNIADIVNALGGTFRKDLVGERFLTTPSHYAYLKISEGCDRKCTFCAIPMIRGRQVSKTIDDLTLEAEYLSRKGVKELILIAQDLTAYGTDIYGSRKLSGLLSALEETPGIEWIRLHYAYPAAFPADVVDVMKRSDKICRYLDIPFQHISEGILRRMRRGIGRDETLRLIDRIRAEIPHTALRTSLLVGYPGETEQEFEELKEFVIRTRFDRLGVFTYSEEEGTAAARHEADTVSHQLKRERMEMLMEIQSGISLEINQQRIGRELKVLIDTEVQGRYIGRTEYDSPEVDNEVIISSHDHSIHSFEKEPALQLVPGEFRQVKITGAEEYDLYGEVVK